MTTLINKWILVRAVVVSVAIFCFLTELNIDGGDRNRDEMEAEKAPPISARSLKSEARVDSRKNPADLKFNYEKRKRFRGAEEKAAALVSERAVLTIARDLKKRIGLPFDIQVVFEECGGPDSFYDEDTHRITICYELIEAYYHLFSQTPAASAARGEAAKGATVSMFLHEVAHALIDGWDLPITGREEDAADQFSTLLLINGIPNGDKMALEGARAFELLAELERGQGKDYSDPHSLDEQRFFNTICLVYGHRPEQYEYLIRNGTLPKARAFECEETYARANKSWQVILAPHVTYSNY